MIKDHLSKFVALLLSALTIPLAHSTPDSSASVHDGWQSLYHGTLDDFRIYFRGEGYIKDVHQQDVFIAEPDQIHVRNGTSGLLVTKTPHSSYHVKVDYRWGAEDGSKNAGLMTHVDLDSKCTKDNRPLSVEINMKHDCPGSIWLASKLGPFASSFVQKGATTFLAQDHGGIPYEASPFGKRTIFANYPGAEPNSKPWGEWNTLEAIVRGSESVEIIHNGVVVNRITDLRVPKINTNEPGALLTEGGIGLQSEGQEIFYRNFVIKPLQP